VGQRVLDGGHDVLHCVLAGFGVGQVAQLEGGAELFG
jgi:hypothetical protein